MQTGTRFQFITSELQADIQLVDHDQDTGTTGVDAPEASSVRLLQLQPVPVGVQDGPFNRDVTALLEVLDGVYTAANEKQISVLIGLDLSAAFDTVDHSLLIERLQLEFGVNDMALDLLPLTSSTAYSS